MTQTLDHTLGHVARGTLAGAVAGATLGFVAMLAWVIGYDSQHYGIGGLVAITVVYGAAAALLGGVAGSLCGAAAALATRRR